MKRGYADVKADRNNFFGLDFFSKSKLTLEE